MADISGASAAAGRAMAAAMRLRGRATGLQLVRQRVCDGRSIGVVPTINIVWARAVALGLVSSVPVCRWLALR